MADNVRYDGGVNKRGLFVWLAAGQCAVHMHGRWRVMVGGWWSGAGQMTSGMDE